MGDRGKSSPTRNRVKEEQSSPCSTQNNHTRRLGNRKLIGLATRNKRGILFSGQLKPAQAETPHNHTQPHNEDCTTFSSEKGRQAENFTSQWTAEERGGELGGWGRGAVSTAVVSHYPEPATPHE